MKWSKAYIFTLKDSPSDAEIPSHKLLVRAGMIRKIGQGVHTYGPLMLRAIRKFENIVREELEKSGCIELLMPIVQPKELWEETDRWNKMGKGLLKFKNRLNQDWCLGATHEEVITDFVRKDIKSYRDLPIQLFQIATKYRDEIRPRFGLMRGREFIMKDAYSFDMDKEQALLAYQKMFDSYNRIFQRLGADFRVVNADSGNIGGDQSQEFHILAESGEDHLLVSEDGSFAANVEVCPASDEDENIKLSDEEAPLEVFDTPGLKTIADLAKALKKSEKQLVKTMFYSASKDPQKDLKPVGILLRGSDEVNPIKLKNLLDLNDEPLMLNEKEVRSVTGANPGSCGPIGLNIPIYMDKGVANLKNYTVGANKDDKHYKNVNHPRDFKTERVVDIRLAKEGDLVPNGKGKLKSYRGIEVGHIFYLGTVYSKAMNASFLDKNGKSQSLEMGCYGIGISRTVQAVIEQNHDKDGMIWPVAIAPYVVHICLLDPKDEKVSALANQLYDELNKLGIDCLLDDRDERPGVKFKDADLLGMPLRVILGGRGVANGEVELVERKTGEKRSVALNSMTSVISDWWRQQGI
ncbi:MAG: proline--tRNA ligase [Bdellovibrionaceae bacterium]|nr:proline--tRNA ligase [Pseudobdellovibrionaceae bacterium]